LLEPLTCWTSAGTPAPPDGVTVSNVEPGTEPDIALIVEVAVPTVVAKPLVETVAMFLSDEDHVTDAVRSCMLPSLELPVALNCCWFPSEIVGFRRWEQPAPGARPRRPWWQWRMVVEVQQQILLAPRARPGPGCDARALPGLRAVAARGAPRGVVLADAAFASEAHHQHLRQRLGAKSLLPARPRGVPHGAIWNPTFRAFRKKPYRQRAQIASIFSAVKRQLSSRAPGRSLATQIRQALLLGLAYNLYRLRHRFAQTGCQQRPSVDSKPLT